MTPPTSPQAFEGLRIAGSKPWRRETAIATVDHNVPTTPAERAGVDAIADPLSRLQVRQLDINCKDFGITQFGITSRQQGLIHVIGPEQEATLRGMPVVAGDSRTSTHGAFAALAFGVGASDVEHVLATQTLGMRSMKTMCVQVDGALPADVTAKDLILAIIGRLGTTGGTGHAIEFTGSTLRALSMQGRMTLCNMAIGATARVGLLAVDNKTIACLHGRPCAPGGIHPDEVFIGWCTNARIEDLRAAAAVIQRRRAWPGTHQARVVPGSGLVKAQAEAEGLDRLFTVAGVDWRDRGCSMCLGMNADRLGPSERCASSSNRNFEGRQSTGGRSHLVSPAMLARGHRDGSPPATKRPMLVRRCC